jgi:hypothetical protein
MKGEFERAKEDLISRGALQSSEALLCRESIIQSYLDAIDDEWRKTSRHVDDLVAQVGLIAKPWFDADEAQVSEEGQDRMLEDARGKFTEMLNVEWPREVSD